MRRKRRRPVSLGQGGPSWEGWSFAPYGRATEYRLIDPDGTTYTAGEIRELTRVAVELDYLRQRLREHDDQASSAAIHFTPDELRAVSAAADILARVLPPRPYRRPSHCDKAGKIPPAMSPQRFFFLPLHHHNAPAPTASHTQGFDSQAGVAIGMPVVGAKLAGPY